MAVGVHTFTVRQLIHFSIAGLLGAVMTMLFVWLDYSWPLSLALDDTERANADSVALQVPRERRSK